MLNNLYIYFLKSNKDEVRVSGRNRRKNKLRKCSWEAVVSKMYKEEKRKRNQQENPRHLECLHE